MAARKGTWRGSIIAALMVILNVAVVTNIFDLSYDRFDWRAFATIYMPGDESLEPGGCSDRVDNDGDNLIDCADLDCDEQAVCTPAPVPALGWYGLLASLLILLTLGWHVLRRDNRKLDGRL